MYPQPENIGLTLDPDHGSRVLNVDPKSAAAHLGVRAKDTIRFIGDTRIASVADVQFALHQGPKQGNLSLAWDTPTSPHSGMMDLKENWRRTDVSWRWSLKSMSPNPSIIGDDLDADGRKLLGIKPGELAYRHMNFLTPTGRQAGLQANDVIVGIDDKPLSMTARQFDTYIRLNYRVGQEITLNVLRGKDRVKVKLKLPD
jgi:serine protease Do